MANEATIEDVRVVVFAPEHWGEVDRFQHFWFETYTFAARTQSALGGVNGHFRKADLLLGMAKRLAPSLKEDEHELRQTGYSPGIRSSELAAVIETIYCSLYSSVDCARQVIVSVFKGYRGLSAKSTRKVFQRTADGLLDERLPKHIKEAFGQASWYPELRRIRDAVVHSSVGTCHTNKETAIIHYMNAGELINRKALVVEDVFQRIDGLLNGVNVFLGRVFHALNGTLKDDEVQ